MTGRIAHKPPKPDANAWPREQLMPIEALREYSELWIRVKSLFPLLPPREQALIVSLVVDTCRICYTTNSSCQCGNDE